MADHVITADVAGMVWKIEARAGQTLAAQDTIMILESMKMEVPVAAPTGGTLREVLVEEGETIGEGQRLAVIEG
ncbi:MAG TPA: acetyl-CoA carboxylase biotin carboxyl carrier protein subunit [Alphaproteobacteria bacterium]|nr:acetyl-CoA carboxylase biotin carboxyl carrier protein subunit [Alphaproteobacteria bacterium]